MDTVQFFSFETGHGEQDDMTAQQDEREEDLSEEERWGHLYNLLYPLYKVLMDNVTIFFQNLLMVVYKNENQSHIPKKT